MDIGSQDLISSLPDALVCHILSFLSTEDVALTSVLSKRWRYMLAFVPILDFDDTIYDNPNLSEQQRQQMRRSFMVFVDRVMALQGNASLNKFTLRYDIGRGTSCVDRWILNVLDRGVVDLELCISPEFYYLLPSKVFMCKTLVRLKVSGTNEFIFDEGEVIFPKLKTLHIVGAAFEDIFPKLRTLRILGTASKDSGDTFSKLISSCSVLEEFVMDAVHWELWRSCSVSNPSLKRLTIRCYNFQKKPKSVSFDTPNVVFLEYTDAVAIKYPKVNFGSLLEASVDLRITFYRCIPARESADVTGFFMGICTVEILYLSAYTLEVLEVCCKTIPVFDKLYQLTIETDLKVGWESLPYLLEKCPNLETLVFEGLYYKNSNRCWNNNEDWCTCKPWDGNGTPICLSSCSLLSSPVRILKVMKFGKISYYNYDDSMDRQTDLIKHFVESMPNLEQVVLYYNSPLEDDLRKVSTKFQQLAKVASTKCKIQVISDNISVSCTVQSSSSTNGLFFSPFQFEDRTV